MTGIIWGPQVTKTVLNCNTLNPEVLPRFLVLPMHPAHKRKSKLNSTWERTLPNTTAIIPTFFGIQDYGGVTFYRVWDKYIHRANIYAHIASCAYFRVNKYRLARSGFVRESIYLFLDFRH